MRYVLHHLVATELEAVDEGAVGAQVIAQISMPS